LTTRKADSRWRGRRGGAAASSAAFPRQNNSSAPGANSLRPMQSRSSSAVHGVPYQLTNKDVGFLLVSPKARGVDLKCQRSAPNPGYFFIPPPPPPGSKFKAVLKEKNGRASSAAWLTSSQLAGGGLSLAQPTPLTPRS
jgi:hypothetical protein